MLLWPSFLLSQTCVIGIVSSKGIFVGADSKTSFIDAKGNRTGGFSMTCKIQSVGKFHFAHIHSFPDLAYPIANEICKKGGSIKDVIWSYSHEFVKILLPRVDSCKFTKPEFYKKLTSDSNVCQTLFFGYENDSAFLILVVFRAIALLNHETKISVSVSDGTALIAGETSAIDSIFQSTEIRNRYAHNILKLMKVAAHANPEAISEPFDLIKVTRGRSKWIKCKKMCKIFH